ncbi:MAG: hypothetical protein IPM47_11975 [Sphingobacteriales bacterium]|nr:MAG: hypothetical protein IPM47_11975 [Sphingobacteriales bacterium]
MSKKNEILVNIKKIKAEDLYRYIYDEIVTFKELQETGNFEKVKQDFVTAKLEEDSVWKQAKYQNSIALYKEYEKKYPEGRYLNDAKTRIEEITEREREDTIWQKAKRENTFKSYEEYLCEYPDGRHVADANNLKAKLKEEIQEKKKVNIRNLLENPDSYTPIGIRGMLERGELSENDLINNHIITAEKLQLFLKPPNQWSEKFGELQTGWKGLKSVPLNRTDIYFLGIAGSGKTCMLAGLLNYCYKEGLIRIEVENPIGKKYADLLINSVDIGYAPLATTQEGVNYIPAKLRSNSEIDREVNIIEMSGELFNNTSVSFDIKDIGVNYLTNDNRKIFFLVLDYQANINASNKSEIASQAQKLDIIVQLLNVNDILSKTDGLFTIITKCDLLPGGVEDIANAEKFLNQEYKSLMRTIDDYWKEYKFTRGIFPFSLGRFMLSQTFDFHPASSKEIYNIIIQSAFGTKPSKKSWFT